MKNNFIYKIVLCAILSAFATLAFVLEGLFPPLILPGARLGLSNVFILLAIILLGGRYALITLVVKVLLGSLFSGNLSAIIYSLPSGLIALLCELTLYYFARRVSTIAISVFGAVINVCLQNVTFCLVTNTAEYLSYLPYLALIGVVAGVFVGTCVFLITKKVPEDFFKNEKIEQN